MVGFKVVYVFDISQTAGDPLPEPPGWMSPEKNVLLSQKLIQFAESRGIKVLEQELRGQVQGVSKGGTILLSPDAGILTLIHEIAHEMMHREKDRPIDSMIREMEAESVAFVVAKYFGLDGLTSPNYVAFHRATSKEIMTHLEIVRCSAMEIINSL